MKKVNLLNVVMIIVILFSGSRTFGQSINDSSRLKLFGLGLHMEQFKLNDLSSNMPATKIIFTINPNNYCRLEPEIGYRSINDKVNDLKDKSLNLGIGAFGMYQQGKANIYLGFRLEYSNFKHEYKDNILGKQTENTDGISIGPAVGVEYFFGQHFSIGGEVALKYINYKSSNIQYGSDSELDNYITESGLILRFYL